MRKQLLKKLDHLDLELDELLTKLTQYDEMDLADKPAPDIWSPLQIMHHLLLSESLSLAYVKKKLSYNPKLAKAGVSSQFRSLALDLALKSPLRFTAANGTEASDLNERKFSNLQSDWTTHRADLRIYILDLDDYWMDKEVYKHPYVGRLSFSQMLGFFQTHFRHHRKQINARLPN
ncbi:MAG: DinB family protein [Saprospiraceae bacterium]|nr:DinB family protein [Saprospiraceae bacterium]